MLLAISHCIRYSLLCNTLPPQFRTYNNEHYYLVVSGGQELGCWVALVPGLSRGCDEPISWCCGHPRLDLGWKTHFQGHWRGSWCWRPRWLTTRQVAFPQWVVRKEREASSRIASDELTVPLVLSVRSKSPSLARIEREGLRKAVHIRMGGHLGGWLPLLHSNVTNSTNTDWVPSSRVCTGPGIQRSVESKVQGPQNSQTLQSSREAGCSTTGAWELGVGTQKHKALGAYDTATGAIGCQTERYYTC